jgi:hypothetical protein
VLFDPNDHMVFCNDKYRSIATYASDLLVPGASFESIARAIASAELSDAEPAVVES